MNFNEHKTISLFKVNKADSLQSSDKFYMNQGQFHTRAFPGLTVLALPYPVISEDIKHVLSIAQKEFEQLPVFCPVPQESFHITIADLAFGKSYTSLSAIKKKQLATAVQEYFKLMQIDQIKVELAGIGHFGSAMAGVLICK